MFHLPLLPQWLHTVFESLACVVGFRVLMHLKKHDPIPSEQRSVVMGSSILGAAIGSKLCVWADNPLYYLTHWQNLAILLPGKGIAGALVGGLIGVEIAKKLCKITQPTGDLFVTPLILAIMIGRVGCFLVGLADHTYGMPTTLPWAVDFGDGIGRHPTQLYEILFLALLLVLIHLRKRVGFQQGQLFQWFMVGYFIFRFGVEFLKPIPHLYGGLNSIQILALLIMVYYRHAIAAFMAPVLDFVYSKRPAS